MPDAWPIFFKQRKPRLLQEQAMPLLIQGHSVLMSGPTASGKTEAAVSPLLQRHISFKRKQISVLYIAPTKALVNDIFHRLDSYLCARMPDSVRRYTGDHHDFKDPQGLFLLITTPEALDSLQLMRPESLASVRAIVVDEIHMLHGNARGQQLRHVIQRIEQNATKPEHPKDVFQKIGMTATLQDMDAVCRLWLGPNANIVKAGDPRDIDITYLPVSIPEGSEKTADSANVIANWFEATGTKKGLIFGNTRNNTQSLAAHLHEQLHDSRWPIHWHTGIITAAERERVEDAMKNDRFGICVATSTLEVGIDIGDLDIIILADPPYSINAFLQRIGRGNRTSDVCKVVVLYSTEQELKLLQALHHCSSTGTLDEIHEYDRAAVRFQQIVSFAWLGANHDKPLTKKNLAARTSDSGHGPVVEDMLNTGSLEEIQGALVLSQELTDQGERRQIHSTISGSATLNMVDSSSGETIISASGQGVTEGALFVGGKIKKVTANVDGTVSLEATRGKRLAMSSLPATRGKRGLGRRIIWALAEVAGQNPRAWEQDRSRVITWGGADYNRLLAIILKMEGVTSHALPDEYGVGGIPEGVDITPLQILEWAESIQLSANLPTKDISQFCERSKYFSKLSSEMQEAEAQRSVPFQGFINWLQECMAIPIEDEVSPLEKVQEKEPQTSDTKPYPQMNDTESKVILKLQWTVADFKNPALVFARALTSHLFSIAGKVSVSTSNTPDIDDLDLDDCAVLLRDRSEITLRFLSDAENSILAQGWSLYIDGQSGTHAEITISTTAEWNSALFHKSFVSLQWLQADFDLFSPLGLIALALSNKGLHPIATHTFVGLACSCGELESAALICHTEKEEATIGAWFPNEPLGAAQDCLQPFYPYSAGSLWLPQQDATASDPKIWFVSTASAGGDKAIPLKDICEDFLPFCQKGNVDFAALTHKANQIIDGQRLIKILSAQEKPSAKFRIPVQDETILYIIPDAKHVSLAIDPEQAPEIICRMIQHGLAHIKLGHIQAGDEFGHGDTLENVIGHGYQCRWDQDANTLIGTPKKESLADCTANEKAQLGVWHMIGEMLGKSLVLHRKAEKYQKAAYQRQAAQRILAQLIEYGGSMLCDGVGLGKTYITTTLFVHFANAWSDQHKNDPEVLAENPFRITVLAPNSVVSTWQREALPPLSGHGVSLASIRVISHTKLSRITGTSSVLVPGPNGGLSDLEHLLLSDLVIVDEAHNFRSFTATRTLVLRDLLCLQPRKDLRRLVLLLTATPVNNSLDDLQQETALLFSRPTMLSDAQKAETYRQQAIKKIQERCKKARAIKAQKGDVASLLIHGSLEAKFSGANNFRDDLDFGPNVQRIGDYLKEQDKKLKIRQEEIKAAAHIEAGQQQQDQPQQTRIAGDLLDRIVVQRSRALCKEIEQQQNSDVDLLFRPDAGKPEKLSYADEYDGIEDVLANFLPLFETGNNHFVGNSDLSPLSLKVYMWYDVREGIKEVDEVSSVVGLQRILVLKRLESSPVSFLITLLRLMVLHAYRLQNLLSLCMRTSSSKKQQELHGTIATILDSKDEEGLTQLIYLATGSASQSASKNKFLDLLSNAYRSTKPAAETDDKEPFQLSLFNLLEEADDSPEKEQLDNLWPLRKALLADFDTLLTAAPRLTKIIFGRFGQNEWPHRFIAGGDEVDWPQSAEWGQRIITDGKIRNLISRLLKARRNQQKVIVFSQFSDSLAYIHSVLKACHHFDRKQWALVVKGFELEDVSSGEVQQLLKVTRIITGATENRDLLVNSFAPYYRIGPTPPPETDQKPSLVDDAFLYSEWAAGWIKAMTEPVDIMLSTDVLAEGVNLQDVSVLVNFDIHWNPVRMIQRAGRIDRRLNPAIEKTDSYPDLNALVEKTGHTLPAYYWHGKPGEAPLIINMILPDEIEEELMLRERIATKTLAIDFTLGLEQGTGAEAQWMENYKYQGISSLNALQKDRAIERLGAYYEQLNINFKQQGIEPDWIEKLNGWFRSQESGVGSPLLAMVKMGRKGGEHQIYNRYLEPTVKDSHPHWLWSQFKPSDSLLNFWLTLDGKTWPPVVSKDIAWHSNASLPVNADVLLQAVIQLVDRKIPLKELPAQEVIRPLQQGITAISAGYFGSEEDRKQIGFSRFFLLQVNDLIEKKVL